MSENKIEKGKENQNCFRARESLKATTAGRSGEEGSPSGRENVLGKREVSHGWVAPPLVASVKGEEVQYELDMGCKISGGLNSKIGITVLRNDQKKASPMGGGRCFPAMIKGTGQSRRSPHRDKIRADREDTGGNLGPHPKCGALRACALEKLLRLAVQQGFKAEMGARAIRELVFGEPVITRRS